MPPDIRVDAVPQVREATMADIERIDSLKLEDFAVDFDRVKLPESGRLSDEDMSIAVASLVSILNER